MASIFVSYRRDDAQNAAGRLVDLLISEFGESEVFMDIDHIQPGQDFETKILHVLEGCRFILVIIGRQWVDIRSDSGQCRLDEPDDYVRREIALGLDGAATVIPVLVEGARMPRAQDLPKDLKRLIRLNAFSLDGARFRQDASHLVDQLKKVLEPRAEIETKKIKVPLTLIGGNPNNRRIRKVVETEAFKGWQLVGDMFNEGLFGIGGGVTLIFQRKRR